MGWLLLFLIAAVQSAGTRPPVVMRFHHLHYRVADPGQALGEAAARFTGTRVILQGVGVGVRVDRAYVLFDRDSGDARVPSSPRDPAAAYRDARAWLERRGFIVRPSSLAETAVAAGDPDAVFDHLAFAVDDLPAAVSALSAKPQSLTDDTARFTLDSGLVVEIVRDTDRPDTHWCPMHPDVRRPGPGTCPRCAMALVPIPPPRLGEYRLDVTMTPRPQGGAAGLRLIVREPESGARTTSFLEVHERPFHLFIVSRDLSHFAHVHPERRADGAFEWREPLAPGQYTLIADFLPAGGTPQLVQKAIVTPGFEGPLFAPLATLTAGALEQRVSGLRITLEAPAPRPGRETVLRFQIADAASGRPITDLQPYLGAAGHLLAISRDAATALHAHPEGEPTGGPGVSFGLIFPSPGLYKVWVQVQRLGTVVTAPFVIAVPPA